MNTAHLHLLLTHLAVLGAAFGVLSIVVALIRKSDEVKRFALVVLVGAAVAAIPAYLTGEPAEEIVEHLAGVSESLIEVHEDAAIYSLVLIEFSGLLALLSMGFINRPFGRKLVLITSLVSVAALGSIVWTANLGGKIRHSEIRADSGQQQPSESKQNHEGDDHDDDHDDD